MLKKYITVCISMLVLGSSGMNGVFAQNTKRAFKLLEKIDYAKSYDMFMEAFTENKQSPSALLGLSLILADEKSPYYDLISAWEYANMLNVNLDQLSTEETEFIGDYFYNTETRHISRPVKKKIEYVVETIETKLIKYIREENNLEIVYKVLEKFPDFRHYNNVIHIRNQLEFRKYEKQNTLEGYLEFINKFPDAAQVDKAIRYRNKLAYQNACRINSVEAYKEYLKKYPDAVEASAAIKQLHAVAFERAKKINTIAALNEFIAEYPNALEISDAKVLQKQLLYEQAKKIQTLQAYNEFIRKYPEGQYYIDIFNLKSLDVGMHFLKTHPLSTENALWARSFNEEENEEQTVCMAVDSMNQYIVGGTVFRTDTGSTDAWILKLDSDGKMLWNKLVGEAFNDEVKQLAVNNRNEIFGVGLTYTGIDSSSAESWLFKMGADGQKLWSKKLGKMHVNTMLVNQAGSIFLGGYLINDSLDRLYSIVVLNSNAKRLWGRTYTGRGEIVTIAACNDQKMLITGNHWRAKIDPRGYLEWEAPFSENDSMVYALVSPEGSICYLGFRNGSKLVLQKTTSDNNVILDKELMLPEVPVRINSVINGNTNQLIALITFEQHQSINWINTKNGEITVSSRLPFGLKAESIITDHNNNLLITGCEGEMIVIKNNGLMF